MAIIVKRSITGGESDLKAEMLDTFYPVGSYYETSDITFNPNASWGGTWVEDTDGRVLVATNNGTFATVGATGGEETHQLTTAEMPSHSHRLAHPGNIGASGDFLGSELVVGWNSGTQDSRTTEPVGGSTAHNNLQPYVVVKRWHRVA